MQIDAPGILREPVPGNSPPYNLTLNPAYTVGYACKSRTTGAQTFGGSVVAWAEFFLPDGVVTRDSYDTDAEKRLIAAASDTKAVADSRMAASAVLQWAQGWRACIYGEVAPDPTPIVAPGVVAVGTNAVTSAAEVDALLEATGIDANLWKIAQPILPASSLPTFGPNDGGVLSTQQSLSVIRTPSSVPTVEDAPPDVGFVTASMKWVFVAAGVVVLLVLLSTRRR